MPHTVYISSTFSDLQAERKLAKEAVLDAGLHPVAMENYSATERPPLEKCLADVRKCDIYLGIFAYRYGFIPDGHEKSITQLEYEEAGKCGIPRVCFMISDDAPWPNNRRDKPDTTKIDAFRDSLAKSHTVAMLGDPAKFPQKIIAALHKILRDPGEADGGASKAASTSPRTLKRKPPDILPYLSNRGDQGAELDAAIDACGDNLHCKPLVALVHGDQRECHEQFLEKIRKSLLPKFLDLPEKLNTIEKIWFEWPPKAGGVRLRAAQLAREISRRLTGKNDPDPERIVRALNFRKTPVLLHSDAQTVDWDKREENFINAFLQFWNDLPDLAVGQKLFVFVCLKHTKPDKTPLWKKWRTAPDEQARAFLENIDFSRFEKIHGLTLTELRGIEFKDLERWIAYDTQELCDSMALRDKISEFYKKNSAAQIPMADLAPQLRNFLRELSSKNEY